MIFGNEGMPRSGKSLDAMQHIIDSILHGRCIVTNVYGINYAELAKYLAIPEATIRRMLITIAPPAGMDEEEKVDWVKERFFENQHPDCLWIWDEINQFWPVDRQPLPAKWAKFVTEHGQIGMDVLIMGQDLSELHKTWRGRLQRYTRFTKLDMRGKEDHFHWATMTNTGRGRYRKMADGTKPYNKKFFALYRSHREDTTNKGNYKDKRFNAFQPKHYFYGSIFVVMLLCSMGYMYRYFTHPATMGSDISEKKDAPREPTTVKPSEVSTPMSTPAPVAPAAAPVNTVVDAIKPDAPVTSSGPIDYIDKLAQTYSFRLSGLLEREPKPGDNRPWLEFNIDVVDQSLKIHDRFRRAELVALGWTVERTGYGIKLSKGESVHVVRAWPLEGPGRPSQKEITSIKEMAAGAPQTALLSNGNAAGGVAALAGTAGDPVYRP